MTARQRPWPRRWLMTDERVGDRLWAAIDRLPPGQAGIVFRNYATAAGARALLAARIAEICSARAITLAVACDAALARSLGADLVHNPTQPLDEMAFSRSVHSLDEAVSAREEGAALVFVSPVFPTRSHPGGASLDKEDAIRIANAAAVPAIALGGMDESRFAELERYGFYGWAGIDAWLKDAPGPRT